MTRFVDRGATYAAMVGIGMAMTIAVSFLLVIPIEPMVWLLGPLGAILIGYYANSKADRRAGPWPRILANAVYAGAVTAISLALLILATKAIFFFADNGYRDPAGGGSLECRTGADCVYARYLAEGKAADLAAVGVTDAETFTSFYWGEQVRTAGTVIVLTTLGGLAGGALYAIARPKPTRPAASQTAAGTGSTAA